jgi:1-deoxy-D-xylulose-5-phosphate synthase
MVVMAPKDENELRHMLFTALNQNGPVALRYSRGAATGADIEETLRPLPMGKGEILTEGPDILILAMGRSVTEALAAHGLLLEQGISTTIVNCRFVKPIDVELIGELAEKIPRIITVEENVLHGGFGSAVLEALNDSGVTGYYLERLGIADTFVEHGAQDVLRSIYGIDASAIVEMSKHMMNSSHRLTANL